jgi:hypothetical protein
MTKFLVVSLCCVLLWSCSESLPELMTEEEAAVCVAKRNSDLSWFRENCEDRVGEIDGFAQSVEFGNALDLRLPGEGPLGYSLESIRVSGWRDHFERQLYNSDEIRVTGRFVVNSGGGVEVEATKVERLAYSLIGVRAEEGAAFRADYASDQEQARVAYATCAKTMEAGKADCPTPTSHIGVTRDNDLWRLDITCTWGNKILIANCRYRPSSNSAVTQIVSAQ